MTSASLSGLWILGVSIACILACLYDKTAAKAGWRRLSEASLFTLAIAGGALAMLVCMRMIRHKTRHRSFMIGLPVIILIQLGFALGWAIS